MFALATGQVSFGMERVPGGKALVPSVKPILELVCPAPRIWEKSFDKFKIEAATFDPENKNKVLLMLSGECWSYDLESENLIKKDFITDQDKTNFIKNNSARPKQVGPYMLDYGDAHTGPLIMLGDMVTVHDAATQAPLYTIKHEPIIKITTTPNSITPNVTTILDNSIKFATFNTDQTQLITVSNDNKVKVSTIKKPITLEYNGTSIACNPDIVCTSKMLEHLVNLERQNKSVEPSISFNETFDSTDKTTFNLTLQLMALVHKMALSPIYKIDEINELLSVLDVNSLCALAEASDYLQIVNEKINLTDVICECIARKYDPKTDQSCIKKLPLYCKNMIAHKRVEGVTHYIDCNEKPLCSFECSYVSGALSPNGKTVALGSWDKTVKIWDIQTGQCIKTLVGHTGSVKSVAFNPHDPTILATGSWDKTVKIWDIATGLCTKTLVGHDGYVYSVAFNPHDPTILATGSWYNTVKIWNIDTGQCIKTLKGHTGIVYSVAFNPQDPNILASGSYDKTVKIWDLDTEQCTKTLVGHTDYVRSVVFHPEDPTILATASWDMTVKMWSLNDQAKQELLNNLTIEQADLLIEKVCPAIEQKEKFKLTKESKEYKMWETISPKARECLNNHVDLKQ